jgi:hypothetical protein
MLSVPFKASPLSISDDPWCKFCNLFGHMQKIFYKHKADGSLLEDAQGKSYTPCVTIIDITKLDQISGQPLRWLKLRIRTFKLLFGLDSTPNPDCLEQNIEMCFHFFNLINNTIDMIRKRCN